MSRMRVKGDRVFPHLCVLPGLLFIGLVVFFPLGYSFITSLLRWNLLRPSVREYVGLSNYLSSLGDPAFLNSLKVTLKFVSAVVFFEVMIGLLLAVLIYRLPGEKSGNLFRSTMLFPVAATPVVAALAWRWIYHPRTGIIAFLFDFVGREAPLFLSSTKLSLTSVTLVDVWKHTPFVALVLLAGLLSVPQSTCEAAHVDGASEVQVFFYVIFPQLKPVIAVAVLIRTMDAFKTFDLIWMLTQGGPAETTNVLSVLIYKTAFQFFEIGKATAYSWLMLSIIGILALFYLRVFKER